MEIADKTGVISRSANINLFYRLTQIISKNHKEMSNKNSTQHGDRVDDTIDLVDETERRMERYFAPGGLFKAQQRRVLNDGDRDDDTIDLVVATERRMERYYATGGLFEEQQRRVRNDRDPRPPPPLEIYEWGEFFKDFLKFIKTLIKCGHLRVS